MMLEHLHKFGRLGLILTSIAVSIQIADVGNVSNLNWDELSEDFMQTQEVPTNLYKHSDTTMEKFHRHMRDIVIDMVRLEYI